MLNCNVIQILKKSEFLAKACLLFKIIGHGYSRNLKNFSSQNYFTPKLETQLALMNLN